MRRVPELDALRGLAAMGVVLLHTHAPVFYLGWTGVNLFFVLSGFLITGIILDHKDERGFLTRFYVRRGLRIWPVYYLALTIVVLVNASLPRGFPIASGVPWLVTYLQNVPEYWGAPATAVHPAFGQAWTLSIEEQFYLLWPPLLLLLGRRAVLPMALGAIAISTAFREAGGPINLLASQADGFALGGLLAWLRRREGDDRLMGWVFRSIIIGGTALLAIALLTHQPGGVLPLKEDQLPHPGLEILAVNLFFCALIGEVSRWSGRPGVAFLRWAPLVFLGQISYGLYLYHPIVGWLVSTASSQLGINGPWLSPLLIPLYIAVAAASWRWFEQPILRLKDRFEYERANAGDSRPQPEPAGIEEAGPVLPSPAVS